MMRPAPPHRAWLCAAILLWLTAGCGGQSSVSVGVPTENNGPVINGQVAMPSGRLAAAPAALDRLAAFVVARVEALVANNVFPVGAGVDVRLLRIAPGNIKNGTIVGGETINRATTETDGSFALRLPTGTDPGTCRFVLEVGNSHDHTLTRAFVDASTVDINFESEATVRLLLDEIKAGHVGLCDLDANEIFSVRSAVQESENQAFGVTVAAINASAKTAAASDPNVQAAISRATGQVTPLPTSTDTAPPTLTATAPVPTATAPPPPTRTNTNTPVRSNTVPPTRTNTATVAPTDTVVPTRTNTNTPVATNTTAPTNTVAPTTTNTPVPTNTATRPPTNTTAPTNTPVPSATAPPPPSTPTATAPPTATATVGTVPEVNLGVVVGTAGFVVDVPVTLLANGAQIASVSTDIEFDTASLSVVPGDQGAPDCVVDARLNGVKDVVVRAADIGGGHTRLRVGLIGLTNNTVITSGPLFTCRFLVEEGASGGLPLLNTPEAAGQQAQAIVVDGSDGRIDASAAPATLGLSAGTAAAGAMADITATLNPVGQDVAAVSADIRFDPTRVSVDAEPDCTLDAAVAALGKEIVTRPLPAEGHGTGRKGLRVGVFGRTNNTALPTGALFSCRFMVESSGPPVAIQLTAEGADRFAASVGLLGLPGRITVP
ncbi:MAG TPA: hypothetical protein VL049_11400 [Candidatus Dormibacteraeota bacterium]|nr:hypothetical protein [Candidatus Dormibacteraeota bacterium]